MSQQQNEPGEASHEVDVVQRQSGLAQPDIDLGRRSATLAPDQRALSQLTLARTAQLDASALAAEPGGLGSALLLLRAAVTLLAQAQARSRSNEGSAADAAAWIDHALQGMPADDRRDVEAVLDASSGVGHVASLDESRLREVYARTSELARVLEEPLEAVAARAKRKELWRGALWILAVLTLTGAAWKALAPSNLALHAAVTVSSSDPRIRSNPRGLVDGDRKSMGIHTRKGQGEWASIDLGALETINEVRVYNRRDCCLARAIPLRVEVSANGADYVTVGRREEVFDNWTLIFAPMEARYVRVFNESNNILHLAEVEVY